MHAEVVLEKFGSENGFEPELNRTERQVQGSGSPELLNLNLN
jgi:hypothetical protein